MAAAEAPASETLAAVEAVSEAVAPEAEAASIAPPAAAAPAAEPPVETVAEAPAGEVAPAVVATPAEPVKDEDEMIEVWRLAPRRPRPAVHHHRPAREAGTANEAHPRNEDGKGRRPWRDRKAPERREGAAAATGETPSPQPAGRKA